MTQKIPKVLKKVLFFILLIGAINVSAQNFKTVWRTTTPNESITIPTAAVFTGNPTVYNYTVDWGDGSSDTEQITNATHVYTTAGDYTVTISGVFPWIIFNNGDEKLKIISIEEWGSSIAWTSMDRAFRGCTNLVNNANDVPNLSGVTDLSSMFLNCTNIGTGSATNWSSWVTTTITDMTQMFAGASLFNKDIGNWDVSSVTNMSSMFFTASSFDQNLASWDVSSVTNMSSMFGSITLSTVNYDALLVGWNAQSLQNDVQFSGGQSKYNSQEATDARANMISSNNWNIKDSGRNILDVTWTGTMDTDWNTSTNWNTAFVPSTANDVIIPNATNSPIISATTNANTNNITVDTDASLVIESGGSLIVGGTSSGELTYKVSVEDTNWHLISSPVVGEQYDSAGWITDNSINTSGTGGNEGISTYDNTIDANGDWNYYQTGSGINTFEQGEGYALLRTGAGDYSFTGTIPSGDFLRTITIANEGTGNENRWNLVGNPFSSYIYSSSLLGINANNLTDTHSFLYVWDATNSVYIPIVTNGFIHPGQAFFVNAANSNADNFIIEGSSLVYQTDIPFYKNSTPSIQLFITDGTNSKYTEVKYEENATTSLDKGLDAGTFTGASTTFSVYSHLVENSEGVDFILQSLPKDNYENMVIPIGVNADAGKEIVFSAEVSNLPEDVQLFLEDKGANSFTQLNEENSEYKVTLIEMSNGIGRFYLHTAAQKSLSTTPNVVLNNVSIYKTEASKLRIAGTSQGKSTMTLFNLEGKQILSTSFILDSLHDVSLPKLSSGVYIVQLQTEVGVLNKKIILE